MSIEHDPYGPNGTCGPPTDAFVRALREILDSKMPGRFSISQGAAYYRGARIALRFMQGVADECDPVLSAMIGKALDTLPGGDNPGHRE